MRRSQSCRKQIVWRHRQKLEDNAWSSPTQTCLHSLHLPSTEIWHSLFLYTKVTGTGESSRQVFPPCQWKLISALEKRARAGWKFWSNTLNSTLDFYREKILAGKQWQKQVQHLSPSPTYKNLSPKHYKPHIQCFTSVERANRDSFCLIAELPLCQNPEKGTIL